MDATFEQGADQPLRLVAETAEDLSVMAALTQDAVCKVGRVNWMRRRRRMSFLLYRFRWEDADKAKSERRDFERVASALTIDDVETVRARGVKPDDKEAVFNILSISFTPGEDGAGVLRVDCSGEVSFEMDVECLNTVLTDLTRPWAAGGIPEHS